MAALSLQTESVSANPLDNLTTLACSVQSLLSRATYLARAVTEAADLLELPGQKGNIAALDRVLVFNEMIEETAKAARDQAEEIERIAGRLKYPR